MKLYFCRRKDDSNTYMSRLHIARAGYTTTQDLDEVIFSTDLDGMKENADRFPELEVCCLDAAPIVVYPAKRDSVKSPLTELSRVSPDYSVVERMEAEENANAGVHKMQLQ